MWYRSHSRYDFRRILATPRKYQERNWASNLSDDAFKTIWKMCRVRNGIWDYSDRHRSFFVRVVTYHQCQMLISTDRKTLCNKQKQNQLKHHSRRTQTGLEAFSTSRCQRKKGWEVCRLAWIQSSGSVRLKGFLHFHTLHSSTVLTCSYSKLVLPLFPAYSTLLLVLNFIF